MRLMWRHLIVTVRLQFRNPMALIYSYMFPAIFLIAFLVVYRHEDPPLIRHLGELLTVTALGGACFGLPTSLVAERERGVWRRFRVMPVHLVTLVATTAAARYLLLLTAGAWQLALALALGMPMPAHLGQLFVTFSLVALAFIGLGLLIAALADTVPAVQALGQCVFLPMLIIGGVAVRLESLPAWAQHLSAFFPGRYAVQAIQSTAVGGGLPDARFSAAALVVIGVSGAVAALAMFRWESQQRFASLGRKRWLALALGAWLAIGVTAEATKTIVAPAARPSPSIVLPPEAPADAVPGEAPAAPAGPERPGASMGPESPRAESPTLSRPNATAPMSAAPATLPAPPVAAVPVRTWRDVTAGDIELNIVFTTLPPDDGVVAPMAATARDYGTPACVRKALPGWPPASASDLEQRTRNLLLVAAVPDVLQLADIEPEIPVVVFGQLRETIAESDLIKLLYWVATHPLDGDLSALDVLAAACLDVTPPADVEQLRERTGVYATKMLGRLLGKVGPVTGRT